MTRIHTYDTTLRDGSQGEGINFSLQDKLLITRRLDELGVDFVEGGYPLSNPKDFEYFQEVRQLPLRHARVVAFGMTRRKGVSPAEDTCLKALLDARTPVVTIVGKTWDLHVRQVLGTTLDENLRMISDSVAYCKAQGREVIYDAEHFFDGYKANPEYALQTLRAAEAAGAAVIVLCDTNGGRLPHEIEAGVEAAGEAVRCPLGIHPHNDCEVAVANAIAGVRAGAVQVQGTINGIGERCGNANLVSIIPDLQLKLGYQCVPPARLKMLREVSMLVYELANVTPHTRQAYVGHSAFTHKAGLHVSGIQRSVHTYEHIDPAAVGNDRHVVLSELSGRANILYKSKEFGLDIEPSNEKIGVLLDELKRLEALGYTFDGADASFELLMLRTLGFAREHFRFVSFRVFDDKWHEDHTPFSEAVVVIDGPDGVRSRNSATGNGPVNALDSALRGALMPYFPALEAMQLADYKVRVLIESTDGRRRWGTVGLSSNVVEASWQALVDSVEYKLHKDAAKPRIVKHPPANGTRPRERASARNGAAARA